MPETLQWREGGRDPRVFGHSWLILNDHPLVPKSPSYPHSEPIRPLPAPATSSDGPFRSLPSLNAGAPGNAGNSAKSPPAATAKSFPAAQRAPIVNLTTLPGPTKVYDNGSKTLLDFTPAARSTQMGWVDAIARWGRFIETELHVYAVPFVSMQEYSRSRPEWHQRWASVFTFQFWLFAFEEHSLTCLQTSRWPQCTSTSKTHSWRQGISVVIVQVCDGDLSDELGQARSFRYPDTMSLHVVAVMDHVRSILRLRVPLPSGFAFHCGPT